MSKQFFKVSVKYDTNCGYSDHKTWYVRCNNTIDYFMNMVKLLKLLGPIHILNVYHTPYL